MLSVSPRQNGIKPFTFTLSVVLFQTLGLYDTLYLSLTRVFGFPDRNSFAVSYITICFHSRWLLHQSQNTKDFLLYTLGLLYGLHIGLTNTPGTGPSYLY